MPGLTNFQQFVRDMTADNSPVGRIVATLALPIEYEPIRFEGIGSGIKSSVTKVKEELDFNWTNANSAGSTILPEDQFQIFLFRALACYLRYPLKQRNTAFGSVIYTSQALNPCPQGAVTECTNLPLVYNGLSTLVGQPCGPAIYPGKANGRFGYWLDNQDDGVPVGRQQGLQIQLSALPAANNSGYIVVRYWNGYFWQLAGSIAFTTILGTYMVDAAAYAGPGWYNVEIVNISQDAVGPNTPSGVTSYTVHFTTNRSFWAQRAAPQLTDYATFIEEHRITAAACLWQNNSPELDLSGKVNSLTAPKGLSFSAFIGGARTLTVCAGFKPLDAKEGAYTFLKPDDDDDFTYNDQISSLAQIQSLQLPTIWYPIRNTAPYEIINFAVADDKGRDTTLTTAIHFEYLTLNQLPSLDSPLYTQADWIAAVQILRKTDNHQNNKVHLKAILESIVKNAPVIWRATKAIAGLIPTMPTQILYEGMERVEDALQSSKELQKLMSKKRKKGPNYNIVA